MHRGTKNPHSLKLRRYAASTIDLNEYLDMFPEAKSGVKICETELNDFSLNSMPRICNRQEYVQEFDCESIT